GFRVVLDNGHAADFSALDNVVARYEVNHLRAEFFGQRDDQIVFTIGFAAVADQASQTHTAGIRILHDPFGNIVGCVHRHHLAGADDVDFLGLVFADRHGETTTHHITEYVVEHEIEFIVVGAFFFEEVDGSDNAAACATYTWLRSARLDALDAAVAHLQYIFEFQIFHGAGFGSHFHNGILGFGVQDQTGRIRFRITTDDHHLLAHFGECSHQILRGGRLANTALAVNCTLTHCHHKPPLSLSQPLP